MYNVAPQARLLWDGFFDWLSRSSGVDLEVVAHEAPAPLSTLWHRADLGVAFMCGFPFMATEPDVRPVALAAPVAQACWAKGMPFYASHIVVASSGRLRRPDDLRDATLGWTVRDSQSGYHALRRFLVEAFPDEGGKVFGNTKGPFLNPAGIIAAIVQGDVDAGPIDAYAFELLRVSAPELVSGLHVMATTTSTPCPLLVAAPQAPKKDVEALRRSLLTAHETVEGLERLRSLALSGFAAIAVNDYLSLTNWAGSLAAQGLGEW
jgi:ABC-type phosphate/phosphonate transport system substrate-binding protein